MNFAEFCSTIIDSSVKAEPVVAVCQCCFSENNLKSMLHSNIDDPSENYSEMLKSCFSIEVTRHKGCAEGEYLICDECINKLRDSCNFRLQVEEVQSKLMIAFPKDLTDNEMKTEYSSDENKSDFDLPIKSKRKRKPGSGRKRRCKDDDQLVTLKMTYKKRKPKRVKEILPLKLGKNEVCCYICNESFPTHHNLCAHMAEHFPNHICELCGKSFIKKANLAAHMKTHEIERIPCEQCHKLIKKSGMPRHMLMHTGDNNLYPCPVCPQRFVSFSIRVTHLAEAHNIMTNKYKCKICFKTFRLSSNLSTHFRSYHLKEINHTCQECGKGFFGKSTLKLHMLKHTKQKNFRCEICQKCFGRKYSLNEHLKIHSNVKQFGCTFCDKAFSQKCSLKVHLRKHDKMGPQDNMHNYE